MPRVGFQPTIPVFERARTFRVLDRAVTVIGWPRIGYCYCSAYVTQGTISCLVIHGAVWLADGYFHWSEEFRSSPFLSDTVLTFTDVLCFT
jgi:hypothetical protein